MSCTCLPRSPDDQCPTHGYEAWLKSKEAPVLTPHEKDALDRHIMGQAILPADYEDEEWLSDCCGTPPHPASDVSEDNPVGFCGQCREHCGFERVEEP